MRLFRLKYPFFLILLCCCLVGIYLLFTVNTTNFDLVNIRFADDPYARLSYPTLCPLLPFIAETKVSISLRPYELDELETQLKPLGIQGGGLYVPSKCKSRNRVAIIVPYRYRERNMKVFIGHMHRFLSDQLIEYGIYLVEPVNSRVTFNRGLLMNIGFLESLKITKNKWDCFVFHDVDLLPEDRRNIYSCSEFPKHMSSAVSKFGYKLPYKTLFGGVTTLKKEHMRLVNGFPNSFFGWGGEDDALGERIKIKGLKKVRSRMDVGRYFMMNHDSDHIVNIDRAKQLSSTSKSLEFDGLNTIDYEVIGVELKPLFTHIMVDYNEKRIVESVRDRMAYEKSIIS